LISVKKTFIKQTKFYFMKRILLTKKALYAAVTAILLGTGAINAQTYTWNGSANNVFYNTSNWTSTDGFVAFDDSSFKTVVTTSAGTSPVLSEFTAWQPGIFNAMSGTLTLTGEFNVFFNDWLNGTINVNTGGIFTCRNIIRVGREGMGTVNINGGILRSLNTDTWQGIFIGALTNGNGTVNVNDGGLISGGYQVEVGTRNNFPTGTLNVNTGGTSEAYWTTVVGPNGTININGGTVNTGQAIIVGDLYVDTPGTEGTVGAVVGRVNINSGTLMVNQFDLNAPAVDLRAGSKVVIDNGTLVVKRTGVDFSTALNDHIASGKLSAVEGKTLVVTYDGAMLTTVSAITTAGIANNSKNAFTLYPNPVKDVLNISSAKGVTADATVKIVSLTGETVMTKKLNSINDTVDVSRLAGGMYIASISNGDNNSTTKFIKE
jgi:Secretion system C-terminal sorting domain